MIGYFTDLSEAEDYFLDERFITELWDDLGSGAPEKTKALNMAYNRLTNDPRWTLPTPATATAAELEKLKKAQAEMAYYLVEHLEGEDARKGIQAQGVTQADVVGETYLETDLMNMPVPPFVIALLSGWDASKHFGIVDLARDESKKAGEKVTS